MSDVVPRSKVAKQGVQGIVSLAGGVGAFILAGITGGFLGIIIGGVVTVAGVLLSGSRHERGAGIVTTVVGAATLVASLPVLHGIFGPIVHGVMVGAGIILVGLGGWSLFKFFRGLKSRS